MKGDFRVGEFRVSPEFSRVEGVGGVKNVEPRSMEVLIALAERAGELCTRSELLDAVWADAFVGEEALTHCIWDLRRAFGDNPRKPATIQTVPRRGYRLIAPVDRLAGEQRESRFRLEEEVGAGSMGAVWRAEDTLLGRTVALKFLPETSGVKARKRFLREAKAAAALDHGNVCGLHEVSETADGRLFLVMPYLNGKTLDELMHDSERPSGRRMSWRRAVALAVDAGRGLASAHAKGIVHRDVKPANLMAVEQDGTETVKVLDFGVARLRGDLTRLTATSFSPGTPAYKSPEQSRGEEVDARTDIWSLGVVLFELLSGELPFRGDYEQAVVRSILDDEPVALVPLDPEMPKRLAAILDRALAKDPARRLGSMADLIADLEAVLNEAPPHSDPEHGPLRGTAPEPRRRLSPARLAGISLLVLALSVLSILWLIPSPEPLRVAVLEPKVKPREAKEPHRDLELVTANVRLAVLSTMALLEGLSPLDPAEHDRAVTVEDAARASAADEVLGAVIEDLDGLGRVTLKRLSPDGRVLWANAVEISFDPGDSRLLAGAVAAQLRRAYADHDLRRGAVGLEVSDDDYRRYLILRQSHDAGEDASIDLLRAAEEILESSPRFLEGRLFASSIAWRVGRRLRDGEILDRAMALARSAVELAPEDPRTALAEFRIALARQNEAEAEAALKRFETLAPGSPSARLAHSQILAQRGDLAGAIRLGRQIVQVRPSWKSLYYLANLERRAGEHEEARGHLRQLIERSPGNRRGLSALAELELVYGDLEAARDLYETLLRSEPSVRFRNNLGIVHHLLGDYRAAAEAYAEVLEMAPDHAEATFNLAEAQAEIGRTDEATRDFERVLALLDGLRQRAELGPFDRLLGALSLAHLGRAREAVREVQAVLSAHPESAEVTYQAAMVYSLTGDRNAALVNVERAIALGTQPRWFRVPVFRALADDPVFQKLIGDPPDGSADADPAGYS